jgi:hypothetical protein
VTFAVLRNFYQGLARLLGSLVANAKGGELMIDTGIGDKKMPV